MSYKELARIKADLISRKNSIDIELRGKEDTLDEVLHQIYLLNKKIPIYEVQLEKASSKAIKDLHQKALDLHLSERERLTRAKADLEADIKTLTIMSTDLKAGIKDCIG